MVEKSTTPNTGDGIVRNIIYAQFRTDKPADEGYSQELISVRTKKEFYDNLAG